MSDLPSRVAKPRGAARAIEVFWAALKLGLTSFGGPVAHIAYFRRAYVERLRWLDERTFGDLLALCQFLPGPSSSQLGFAIGWLRAGWAGAVCAWLGFTLPSACLMLAFAQGFSGLAAAQHAGWLAGLKAAAVGVVAHAVWQMARTFCAGPRPAALALFAGALVLLFPSVGAPPLAIVCAACLGGLFLRRGAERPETREAEKGRREAPWPTFVAALAVLLSCFSLALVSPGETAKLCSAFLRSGMFVFGGGHVVLPLLERELVGPGWLSHDSFLAGYAAAQALPGPLFSFSAFLGSVSMVGPGGVLGGLLGMVALFLPGLLLVPAAIPFWRRLRTNPRAAAALAGANAAVVGVLLAALIDPVFPAGIRGTSTLVLACASFFALSDGRIPVWLLIAGAAAAGTWGL